MTRLPALAVGCALLSSLSWGFGISAVKHALGYLPPARLLLVQLVFSSLVIAVLAAVERSRRGRARHFRRPRHEPRPADAPERRYPAAAILFMRLPLCHHQQAHRHRHRPA